MRRKRLPSDPGRPVDCGTRIGRSSGKPQRSACRQSHHGSGHTQGPKHPPAGGLPHLPVRGLRRLFQRDGITATQTNTPLPAPPRSAPGSAIVSAASPPTFHFGSLGDQTFVDLEAVEGLVEVQTSWQKVSKGYTSGWSTLVDQKVAKIPEGMGELIPGCPWASGTPAGPTSHRTGWGRLGHGRRSSLRRRE